MIIPKAVESHYIYIYIYIKTCRRKDTTRKGRMTVEERDEWKRI